MHIDGGGHTINVEMTQPNIILFQNVNGTLENIVVEGFIHLLSAPSGLGLIVVNNYGLISNLTNNANIRGCIVNENHGVITNSINNGTLRQTLQTASFIRSNFGLIKNCINTGRILGERSAGIVYENHYSGTIEECINFGSVTTPLINASLNRGSGIARLNQGIIKDCVNYGHI